MNTGRGAATSMILLLATFFCAIPMHSVEGIEHLCGVNHYTRQLSIDPESGNTIRPIEGSYDGEEEEAARTCGEMALYYKEHPDAPNPDGRFLNADALLEACGDVDFHTYMAVSRDSHLSIFAEPANPDAPNLAPECESVRFHLNNPSIKEIQRQKSQDDVAPNALYPLGDFDFGVLVEAYNKVKTSDDAFDVMSNNCANMAFGMMCTLGIDVDEDDLIGWFLSNVLGSEETKSSLVRYLATSSHLSEIGVAAAAEGAQGEEEQAAEQQVVELGDDDIIRAVKYYVNNFQCELFVDAEDRDEEEDPSSAPGSSWFQEQGLYLFVAAAGTLAMIM
eukprot:CAMPEP_0119546606 /NCGR_PEP_ID=MMETSP1352-20130426/953_1 /TAXON_ID=265584 /ORGANISM="Stauroneis constricta, Strain CCMP1120" /LENGTH=333 /DNA_ID=CAMNT_0007591325 /DNA_START=85 /DNA_END=1086 /DNA_ORIENTATION=+